MSSSLAKARDSSRPHSVTHISFGNMIGKRKREAVVVDRRQPTARHSADDGANEVLRQHFESVFEPLPDLKQHDEDVVADSGDSEDADASHSDWDGLSDDDAQPITTVEVVEHSKRDESETTGRRSTEFKAFMVGTCSCAKSTADHFNRLLSHQKKHELQSCPKEIPNLRTNLKHST